MYIYICISYMYKLVVAIYIYSGELLCCYSGLAQSASVSTPARPCF